ncbi:uncharacterized protein N7484_008255 [Penicillium longicatenatum]|uniref:uncharacterized protein n=1 Tax=Penicillium longicatenatum TaxID=1561947 RepID=UPI002547C16A|nr:uncharacterized protein N7484_008255 [Penicillium longicatenatum]KAJ5634942.1 hypothetical protein N7484_008255 [Penicillium longicatenatum]
MHLYSILFATLALALSGAVARGEHKQQAMTDCFNICEDSASNLSCPPGTEETQLSSGCWTCCDTE